MAQESTSPDSGATLRQVNEAFSRRDFDAVLAVCAPDVVWDAAALGIGQFVGHEALRAFFEDWTGAYGDFEEVLEEVQILPNDVTLSVYTQRARPVGSIGVVSVHHALVVSWMDGLAQRVVGYTDIDEARAVAERLVEERR